MDAKELDKMLNEIDEVMDDIETDDPVAQRLITVMTELSKGLREGVKP